VHSLVSTLFFGITLSWQQDHLTGFSLDRQQDLLPAPEEAFLMPQAATRQHSSALETAAPCQAAHA